MLDLGSYLRLAAGLGFLFASFLATYQYKKNSMKYKNGRVQAILFFLAGVLFIFSALLDLY